MSKRSYKVMQDIDLSQNDLLKVKNIQNVDDEILIQSGKASDLDAFPGNAVVKADNVVLTTNTDSNSKIQVTTEKVVIANTSELNLTSNNILINPKDEGDKLGIYGNTLKIESATQNESKRSYIEVQDSKVDNADVAILAKVREIEFDNKVDIKWDSTTNSLLFKRK